jgi:hypothetical protein
MPYDLTGYDSAGVRHEYVIDDSGAVTGDDDLLPGWLGSTPFEKPEPVEGETAPESGELTPSQVEAMRQHVSKLLTVVVIALQPKEAEQAAPTDPPTAAPTDAPTATTTQAAPASATTSTGRRYTQTELEAMTVTDLRSLANSAQIAGASTMTKAELVTALQAQQRG